MHGIEQGNQLDLHRNIKVVDEDGNELMRYPERLTKPNSELFKIEDISDSMFRLSLKNPPVFQRGFGASEEVENLMRDPLLSEIKNYGIAAGYSYNPHW